MKKLVLFFLNGSQATEEELEVGTSISAQFRNAKLVDPDNLEKPVYVAGHVPACYSKVPVHPSAAEVTEVADSGSDTQGEPETPASGTTEDVEITEEYLESLTKAELIELADENDIELSADDKKTKDNLVAAVFDGFQE